MAARLRFVLHALLLLAVCGRVSVARAETDWPIPRGPARTPPDYQYDTKQIARLPRSFLDDAEAVTLYSGTTYTIGTDGTIESTSHEVTRLNSRKGIEKLGEYQAITFDPTYEKLTLHEARVLKADGRVVPLEPRHVQLRDVGTDYQVYDQGKQLVLSFPNLQVGDAYEVRWTVRGKDPEFGGEFFTRYTFGDDTYPIARDELHVCLPTAKPFRYANINGKIDLKVTEKDGLKHYRWRVTDRPGLPRDENAPAKEELRLQVACSTFASWDAVGQWKQKLRAACWECTPEVRRTVANVTRGLKTPEEKARALTYWVRRNIRYLSRGPSGRGYTPHVPQRVLGNLFGDCKDQAQLLAVMMREVGLKPWLVTLGTLGDGQVLEAVPSPWGTHALLHVEIDGKGHWIDTTITQAGWDFLPRTDRGRLAYLTRDGVLKLLRTPPLTSNAYRVEQTTHVQVQPDGTSQCRREAIYHGSAAWARRESWLDVPPGERRRLVSAELQDAHTKARLLALTVAEKNLLDLDRPVQARFEFAIAKHFTGDRVREASFTDSTVWARFLGYSLDPERTLPFELHSPFESSHRYVIALPLASRFDGTPEERAVRSKWGTFRLEVKTFPDDPRRLEFTTHMRLERTRVDRADFAEFQRFHDDVTRAYRVWLNVRPTQDLADAPALEKHLAGQPKGDPFTAKVLARLYLDHDRPGPARRVLDRTLPRAADDRGLWELRLEAAANLRERIALYRELTTRFPSETKYALALGAACVRRGEHDEASKVLLPLTSNRTGAVRARAHYHLAQSALRQGEAGAALKHLDVAARADTAALKSAEALLFKARVHQRLRQPGEALSALRLGLQLEPRSVDLLGELVPLERRHGQPAETLDHLRRYTIAVGRDAAGLARAAELHWTLGRTEDAFELARRARDIGYSARAQRVLGLVFLKKGDFAQAVFHLDRAELDAEGLLGLLRAQLALGHLDDAGRRVEQVHSFEPAVAELVALEKAIRELLRQRDALHAAWPQPKEQRAAATRIINGFVCAEYRLNTAAPREQLESLVESCCSETLPFGPALALRGWLQAERGQLRRALTDAERALARTPQHARAHLVRGRVRLEQGKADALSDLQRAVQLSARQDADALHWLAAGLHDAGRVAEALRTQEEAALLRPGSATIRTQLQQLRDAAGWTDLFADELAAFRKPTDRWQQVARVAIDPKNPRRFVARDGQGVWYNGPKGNARNLYTKQKYGDLELHLEFNLPKGSNSGVKFHGHYEIQLTDSFGAKKLTGDHCGGIYPRAEARPRYHHIDKGIAPRVNACTAPGTWQTLEVVFQAPRFDAKGKKIANGKIVRATLNGQVIHENQELLTPTGDRWNNPEMAVGPLMLQADHGPVAFRNVRVRRK